MSLSRWRRTVGLQESLIFLYLLAFVRQYFWVVPNNRVAWVLTIVSAVVVWILYLRFVAIPHGKVAWRFALIFGLTLFFIFLLRLPFPDLSFDVLNYRFVHAERALTGPLIRPGDFFPTIFPLNPAPDEITGVFRHLLGFRLATIINYLALLWTGLILDRLLRHLIENTTVRSIAILLIVLTEHILFLLNTYMVDLFSIPLLLEATRLVIDYRESEQKHRSLLSIAMLLGLAFALKLSNAPFVVPIALVGAYEVFVTRKSLPKNTPRIIAVSVLLFVSFSLPHTIHVYRETGSPFFPLYNKIFKSVYWFTDINVGDGRWGPRSFWETVAWPLLSVWNHRRLSELNVYSGRLTLSTVATILCVLVHRNSLAIRILSILFFAGGLLWSLTSGYVRYALFLEILGGALVVCLIRRLILWPTRSWSYVRWSAAGVFLLLLLFQVQQALNDFKRLGWGTSRMLFTHSRDYLHESDYLLRDRDLRFFLSPENRALIDQVDVWIVSSVKSSSLEILLRDVPMLGIHNGEYFHVPESRRKFVATLAQYQTKRMFSLTLNEHLPESLANIRQRGLRPGSITPFNLPYFSDGTILPMQLIEVLGPVRLEKPEKPVATNATEAMPDDAFNAFVAVASQPQTMRAGEKQTIKVTVRNDSNHPWPAKGQNDGRLMVRLADTWLTEENKLLNNTDGRTALSFDLWPGETTELPLTITAPAAPGMYFLEIDLVQEGVGWFKDKGSRALKFKVSVY